MHPLPDLAGNRHGQQALEETISPLAGPRSNG